MHDKDKATYDEMRGHVMAVINSALALHTEKGVQGDEPDHQQLLISVAALVANPLTDLRRIADALERQNQYLHHQIFGRYPE